MTTSQIERYKSKLVRDCVTGCLVFMGTRDKRGGYGAIRCTVSGKPRNFKAHRLAWILAYGEIPKGALVCHRCDNPPCCEPNHLFLGTDQTNMDDMVAKRRHAAHIDNQAYRKKLRKSHEGGRSARGENQGKAKLTCDKVREIRRKREQEGYTLVRLAGEYGVTMNCIFCVIRGMSWKWLE